MTFITDIIIISLLLSTSAAFTVSPSNVERRLVTTENLPPTARFYTNGIEYSYEIGIGKNHPLSSDVERDHEDSEGENDIYEAARFMVEHESVRKFPSPLDTKELHRQETSRADNDELGVKKSKQKSLPKVEPKRQLEDVLFILTRDEHSSQELASTSSSRHPVMVQTHQSRQIDINSVWVEMLIHDQQNTAATALQRA